MIHRYLIDRGRRFATKRGSNLETKFQHKRACFSGSCYYGYVVVFIATLVNKMFVSSPGQAATLGTTISNVINESGFSRAGVCGLYTFATVSSALTLPFLGKCIDNFGPRRMFVLLSAGLGVACFVYSTVADNKAYIFLAFYLLRYFGQGGLYICSFNAINMWFVKSRGEVLSYVTCFNSFMITGAFANWANAVTDEGVSLFGMKLVDSGSWRNTYRFLGVLEIFVISLLGFLFMADRPEVYGMLPDAKGYKAVEKEKERRKKTRSSRSISSSAKNVFNAMGGAMSKLGGFGRKNKDSDATENNEAQNSESETIAQLPTDASKLPTSSDDDYDANYDDSICFPSASIKRKDPEDKNSDHRRLSVGTPMYAGDDIVIGRRLFFSSDENAKKFMDKQKQKLYKSASNRLKKGGGMKRMMDRKIGGYARFQDEDGSRGAGQYYNDRQLGYINEEDFAKAPNRNHTNDANSTSNFTFENRSNDSCYDGFDNKNNFELKKPSLQNPGARGYQKSSSSTSRAAFSFETNSSSTTADPLNFMPTIRIGNAKEGNENKVTQDGQEGYYDENNNFRPIAQTKTQKMLNGLKKSTNFLKKDNREQAFGKMKNMFKKKDTGGVKFAEHTTNQDEFIQHQNLTVAPYEGPDAYGAGDTVNVSATSSTTKKIANSKIMNSLKSSTKNLASQFYIPGNLAKNNVIMNDAGVKMYVGGRNADVEITDLTEEQKRKFELAQHSMNGFNNSRTSSRLNSAHATPIGKPLSPSQSGEHDAVNPFAFFEQQVLAEKSAKAQIYEDMEDDEWPDEDYDKPSSEEDMDSEQVKAFQARQRIMSGDPARENKFSANHDTTSSRNASPSPRSNALPGTTNDGTSTTAQNLAQTSEVDTSLTTPQHETQTGLFVLDVANGNNTVGGDNLANKME